VTHTSKQLNLAGVIFAWYSWFILGSFFPCQRFAFCISIRKDESYFKSSATRGGNSSIWSLGKNLKSAITRGAFS